MKKTLVGLFVCILILGTIVPLSVSSNEIVDKIIYVDDDNTQGPWDGSIEYPYQHIQDGIDDASNGDTVFVYRGFYQENVRVDKSIILQGEDKNTTVIDGTGSSDVIYVSANSVTIAGFSIENGGTKWEDAGIDIYYSCYNSIKNNHISNSENGIWLINCSNNNTISGNTINLNNNSGIRLRDSSSSNIIKDNTISSNNGGSIGLDYYCINNTITGNTLSNTIDILRSNYNIVKGNIITSNNDFGVTLFNSDNNTIIDNTIISDSVLGIIFTSLCDYNSIIGNTIISTNQEIINSKCNIIADDAFISDFPLGIIFNSLYDRNYVIDSVFPNNLFGISIGSGTNNNVTGNTISNTYCGLLFWPGSNNNTVMGNSISNTYCGIAFGFSYFNVIKYNNFINNLEQAIFLYSLQGEYSSNSWNENYWNRPRILPKPIFGIMVIGLIPIPWLQFDWHPAREPYDIP